MQSIKDMVDVNTVVGDAVETQDGTVIVPVSRVSVGFVAGGGDYTANGEAQSHPFAGGSGAGVLVHPVGFLVVTGQQVRLLPVSGEAIYDRLLDLAPELMDRLMAWAGGSNYMQNGGGHIDGLASREAQEQISGSPADTGW